MENRNKDDISFIDLFVILWKRKWFVIGVTLAAIIGVVLYSVISLKMPPDKTYMPNLYTPEAQMLINDKNSGSSNMFSGGGVSSIASLVGVSVGESATNSALAEYLVFSNSFLDSIVDKFNLIEVYEIDKYPKFSSRKVLREKLKTRFDGSTGVFTVSFTDKDPYFACDVINFVVTSLEKRFLEIGVDKDLLSKVNLEENIRHSYDEILKLQKQIQELEMSVSNGYNPSGIPSIMMDTSLLKMELTVQEQIYTGLKTQYESLKVSMASEQPVFQILEYAEVPDRKSGPSRGKLCIIVTLIAFCCSVAYVYLVYALRKMKNDPEIQIKFKEK